MDTQLPGGCNRERDLVNGMLDAAAASILDANALALRPAGSAVRPCWLADVVLDRFQLEHRERPASVRPGGRCPIPEATLIEWAGAFLPRWEDFVWLRQEWPGPIVAKGIVTADDARRAVDSVSASSCPTTAAASSTGCRPPCRPSSTVPRHRWVTRSRCSWTGCPSGLGRPDVARAVARGAQAAMAGRAWAYGLAAAGQPGIERMLTLLRTDMDRTLRLLVAA